MSHEQTLFHRDREQIRAAGATLLICPRCREPLADTLECPSCPFRGRDHDGILSFRHGRADDSPELERLALAVEQGSVTDALAAAGLEGREDLRGSLFDTRRDVWRVPLADHVSGRCLEVGADFGRRSLLLADLADIVYATDSSLSKLRVAIAREDHPSGDTVVPVHAGIDDLPFAAGAFDTIVADLTDRPVGDPTEFLQGLRALCAPGGSLLVLVDGWTRRRGLTVRAGLEDTPPSSPAGLPGTPRGLRSLGTDLGFESASVYALAPTAARPLYVFDVESRGASAQLATFLAEDGGRLQRALEPLVTAAITTPLVRSLYPSYLLVCTDEPTGAPFDIADPLVVGGRARSVLLDVEDGAVDRVVKVPNTHAHRDLARREHAVLTSLLEADDPIVETLPGGTLLETGFGPTRSEEPMGGRTLERTLTGSSDDVEQVLEQGLGWLARFQTVYGGDPVTLEAAVVEERLRFDPLEVVPPPIETPITTFPTPVHGDYLPGNITVEEGSVRGVIDWEYASLEGYPSVDAGMFLQQVAAAGAGGFESGLRALAGETDIADTLRRHLREYCSTVGLPPETLVTCFSAVWVHRLERDHRAGTATAHDDTMVRRREAIDEIEQYRDDIYDWMVGTD